MKTLSSPAWPVDDATRARWAAVAREPETTNSSGSARSFQRLCGDLTQAGDVAYGLYRIMSADVHPTVGLVSRYLRPPGPAHVNLSGEPAPDMESERWLLLVCASMVWAGRAFDFHDRDRPRRNELHDAYFSGAATAYGLHLADVAPLDDPVPLHALRTALGIEPPQSFRFLSAEQVRALLPPTADGDAATTRAKSAPLTLLGRTLRALAAVARGAAPSAATKPRDAATSAAP